MYEKHNECFLAMSCRGEALLQFSHDVGVSSVILQKHVDIEVRSKGKNERAENAEREK